MAIAITGNAVVDAQARLGKAAGLAAERRSAKLGRAAARAGKKSGSKRRGAGARARSAGRGAIARSKKSGKGIVIKSNKTGRGFKGIADYASDTKKNAEFIIGNASTEEMILASRLRSGIKKPVGHITLSLPPSTGKKSILEWQQIVGELRLSIGLDDSYPYQVWRHSDCDHDHIHLIFSRVSVAGVVHNQEYLGLRCASAERVIENRFNLPLVPHPTSPTPGYRHVEAVIALKTGLKPLRIVIADAIQSAKSETPDILTFIKRLEKFGISAIPNVSKSTGKMSGFSFVKDGIAFKGSDVSAKWTQLSMEVLYEPDKQAAQLTIIAGAARASIKSAGGGELDTNRADQFSAGLEHGGLAKQNRVDDQHSNQSDRGIEGGQPAPENRTIGGGIPVADRPADYMAEARADAGMQDNEIGRDDMSSAIVDASKQINEIATSAPTVQMRDAPPHVQAKLKAWWQQHSAIQADRYQITAAPRTADAKPFKMECTPDEIEHLIWNGKGSRLSKLNLDGSDIQIRPISQKFDYVLLDDIKDLRAVEFEACFVSETSTGNFQAVLRLPKDSRHADAPEVIKVAAKALVSRFDADPGASDPNRSLRMAGFTNQKPNRKREICRIKQRRDELNSQSFLNAVVIVRLRDIRDRHGDELTRQHAASLGMLLEQYPENADQLFLESYNGDKRAVQFIYKYSPSPNVRQAIDESIEKKVEAEKVSRLKLNQQDQCQVDDDSNRENYHSFLTPTI